MAQKKSILFLYAEESIHAGAGSSTGTIDKPIQRERHTNVPKIEGSAFRGAAREASWDKYMHDNRKTNKDANIVSDFTRVYGYKDNGENHSAIDFSDAHLLFFPVRSWQGVFAWITCPYVLQKFAKDYARIADKQLDLTIFDNLIDDNTVIVQKGSKITTGEKVLFEEYLFEAKEEDIKIGNEPIGDWIIEMLGGKKNVNDIVKKLSRHIALVSDAVFRDFTELYTHKITRNKIDSTTGTAEGGALFNEEFLPSESILYATLVANNEFKETDNKSADEVMEFVENNLPKLFKVGGDQGIGKGLVRRSLFTKERASSTS